MYSLLRVLRVKSRNGRTLVPIMSGIMRAGTGGVEGSGTGRELLVVVVLCFFEQNENAGSASFLRAL